MKKLSKDAYGGVHGSEYVPYVEDGKNTKSGGSLILLFGILLAILFAASTAYSGMKGGLTVAAGIPGSILGSGLVTLFLKNKSILGKNILAGMSAGGESIASGMIYVLPAIVLMGEEVNFLQAMAVGVIATLFSVGGISIVQDYLLVQEHGNIVYPESMAITESLVASEVGGDSLKSMGIGFGIGGIITALTGNVFGLVNNMFTMPIKGSGKQAYTAEMSTEANPMLAGIGFIVGLKVAVMLFAGSVLTNFAIIPLIHFFTDIAGPDAMLWNDAATAVNGIGVGQIAGSYTKYIGAGMMISGGLIGALQLIPTIISSLKATMAAKKDGGSSDNDGSSMMVLLAGVILTFVIGFVISGNVAMALIGAVLTLILGFLFAIVAGRLAGTLGTSNLPVSGMTIASLVIMAAVFKMMGWAGTANQISLLMFGTLVVLVISVAGTYMQTQKVTMVLGGSYSEMRKYFIISAVVGVATVVGVITVLAEQIQAGDFAAPQASLIHTLTSGILNGDLPWTIVFIGVAMGIVLFLLGLPVMSVAVGAYLPIATTSIILIGGIMRTFVEFMSRRDEKVKEERINTGISLSSGLIAGASIIGLLGAILQLTNVIKPGEITGFLGGNGGALVLIAALVVLSLAPIMSKKADK
ncbi:oligopeptide transporter, OPT family [Vagococcus coleopterorum]|uniref:Oligopeptide transporter, OPT family n=1 Tax=Vagococcus coleopterorum TaxID=2714946 RepID=A0A6G8AMC5_9ENTE|nr:oligopeptide transporter, OPT family [Vagococcus coleopterorum]QIL46234.1 oligopeptide transporter, OPT family [Vagococcus coleopterorum]